MRLLVTGAGGLLGGRLAVLLARRHHVIAGVHDAPGPEGLEAIAFDLGSPVSVEACLERGKPDAVLHSAALADADRCEADPERATALNLRATESLARLCAGRGVRLVALSTDMVLGGEKPFSSETDAPSPLLVYGRTKLMAEAAVLASATDATVLRVALVHGRGHGARRTASEAIADALRGGRRLRLFTDQHRTPVDPESVADAVDRILERGAAGLFHVGGAERLSRYELGIRVAALLGLPADRIDPVTQSEGRQGARRPADVSLDCSRARRELGFYPRALDEGVREGRADGG
jgi:dTDP-4-dehydrorhamnose reductase